MSFYYISTGKASKQPVESEKFIVFGEKMIEIRVSWYYNKNADRTEVKNGFCIKAKNFFEGEKMKKTFVKILAVMMSVACMFATVACGRGKQDDDGRTKLVVGVYDGAVGSVWAKELEKQFETLHPDVNVVIEIKRTDYDDQALTSRMPYNKEDIYFGSVNSLTALVRAGHVADISETVTEKIYNDDGELVESGATKSIEDTLWDDWKQFSVIDGKYYAIPNFTPLAGISYDADLFEEKGYTVPETYDELKTLMNRMVADGITPFTIGADHPYIWYSGMAFWANYEGKNNFMLNSTFSGTDTNLGEVTPATANVLLDQEGKKAYLQFYYDLARNDNYTTAASRGSQSNTEAQNVFVSGIAGGERVGMIIENSFWEREAYNTIHSLGNIKDSYGWGKRNFKYMIAPVNKANDRKTVYLSYPNSYVFVSNYSKKKDLASEFIRFAQTRKSLATYVINTGVLRPYDFTFTSEEKASATPYVQSIIELVGRNDVDFVTMGAGTTKGLQIGFGTNYLQEWANNAKIAGMTSQTIPFKTFHAKKSVTVDQYFNGVKEYVNEKYFAS